MNNLFLQDTKITFCPLPSGHEYVVSVIAVYCYRLGPYNGYTFHYVYVLNDYKHVYICTYEHINTQRHKLISVRAGEGA